MDLQRTFSSSCGAASWTWSCCSASAAGWRPPAGWCPARCRGPAPGWSGAAAAGARGTRRAAEEMRHNYYYYYTVYLALRTDLTHVGEVEAAVEAGHALGPAGGSAGPAVRRVPGVHPVPRLPVPVAAVLVAAHQPPAAGLAHRRGLGAGAGQRGAEEAAAVEGGGVGRGAGRVGHAAVTEGGARGEHGAGAGAEGAAVRLQVTQLPACRG